MKHLKVVYCNFLFLKYCNMNKVKQNELFTFQTGAVLIDRSTILSNRFTRMSYVWEASDIADLEVVPWMWRWSIDDDQLPTKKKN